MNTSKLTISNEKTVLDLPVIESLYPSGSTSGTTSGTTQAVVIYDHTLGKMGLQAISALTDNSQYARLNSGNTFTKTQKISVAVPGTPGLPPFAPSISGYSRTIELDGAMIRQSNSRDKEGFTLGSDGLYFTTYDKTLHSFSGYTSISSSFETIGDTGVNEMALTLSATNVYVPEPLKDRSAATKAYVDNWGMNTSAIRVTLDGKRKFYSGTSGVQNALNQGTTGETVYQVVSNKLTGVGEQVRIPVGLNFNTGGQDIDSRDVGSDAVILVGGSGTINGQNATVRHNSKGTWGIGNYGGPTRVSYKIHDLHVETGVDGNQYFAAPFSVYLINADVFHSGYIKSGSLFAVNINDSNYEHIGNLSLTANAIGLRAFEKSYLINRGNLTLADNATCGIVGFGCTVELTQGIVDMQQVGPGSGFNLSPGATLILTDVNVLGQLAAIPQNAGQGAATVILRGGTVLTHTNFDPSLVIIDERPLATIGSGATIDESNLVHKTSSETIAGEKTFSDLRVSYGRELTIGDGGGTYSWKASSQNLQYVLTGEQETNGDEHVRYEFDQFGFNLQQGRYIGFYTGTVTSNSPDMDKLTVGESNGKRVLFLNGQPIGSDNRTVDDSNYANLKQGNVFVGPVHQVFTSPTKSYGGPNTTFTTLGYDGFFVDDTQGNGRTGSISSNAIRFTISDYQATFFMDGNNGRAVLCSYTAERQVETRIELDGTEGIADLTNGIEHVKVPAGTEDDDAVNLGQMNEAIAASGSIDTSDFAKKSQHNSFAQGAEFTNSLTVQGNGANLALSSGAVLFYSPGAVGQPGVFGNPNSNVLQLSGGHVKIPAGTENDDAVQLGQLKAAIANGGGSTSPAAAIQCTINSGGSSQRITNGNSAPQVNLKTELAGNTAGMASTSNSSIIVPATGQYFVRAFADISQADSGQRYELSTRINGQRNSRCLVSSAVGASDGRTQVTASGYVSLNAGDKVTMLIYSQDGDFYVNADSNYPDLYASLAIHSR